MSEHRSPGAARIRRRSVTAEPAIDRRRSIRLRAALTLATLVGIGAVSTGAYWTDQATVTGGPINAGAMHIDLADNVGVKPESIAWDLTAVGNAALYPGATTARTIKVTNNSTPGLAFNYRVQGSATGPLASALQVTIRRGGTLAGTGNSVTCSGGTLLGAADAAVGTFDVSAGEALVAGGNPASHTFCVQLRLAPTAANSLQSQLGSTVTLTFPATQVAN